MPVIYGSDKTHLTKFLGDQHAWPHYLTIGDIRKDICCAHNKCAYILVTLIPCPPQGAKTMDKVWHSAVGTLLSQLRYLDVTGPGLKWDFADGFPRQCYPLLAAWVRDYPEQVMVAQVSYGLCPLCEIPKGSPMGHSSFPPLDNLRDQHIYSELLEENNISKMEIGPEATRNHPRHSGNPHQCFSALPDAPRPPWS